MRHLLTRAEDGGRATIIRRACRMLYEGLVHSYLDPIPGGRCGVCLLGFRECEIAHLETLVFP